MAQTVKVLATQNLMTLVQPTGPTGWKERTDSLAHVHLHAQMHTDMQSLINAYLKKKLHDETIWENSQDFICMRLKEK